MAVYFCKCGRQVNKSTNADNTGNRDTAQCTGCPYLLPWGPDKYVEGQGFHKDVQGYECRMSPTLSYTTTYRGQANDKCTLHILSLDLDFLDTVQAWIDDHAADTLSAGFSRGSMRGTDFSDKGRYSLSISCAQNKKGMAAKAALIEQFFTGGRVRKDMTLVQEKAHILAAIQCGKKQAQRKDQPMKKQNDRCPLQQECERTCKVVGHERDCDYYVNNRYSTGGIPDQDEILDDEEATRLEEIEKGSPSDLSLALSEPVIYQNDYGTLFAVREHNGAPALMCKPLASDAWTLSGVLAAVQGEAYTAEDLQEVLDDYARAHGWKKEKSESATAPAGAGTQNLSAAGPASLAAKDTNVPTFDYSGLDNQTVEDLHLAEREYMRGRKLAEVGLRRMADGVAMAHYALCSCDNLSQLKHGNRGEASFGAWCDSVGLNRKAAERLLQVAKLFDSSTPREEKVLEELGPSLLYAAAKPSAPAELVRAVKDGDITSHKQYQDALAEIRARDAKIKDLLEISEASDRRADEEERKRKEANEARIAAENKVQQYREIKDAALETAKQQREKTAAAESRARAAERERDEARKERDGAREALQASKMRGDRLKAENDDLKARPIEVPAVDEDEIDRRVEARLQQKQDDSLAEQREIAARNAQDAILLLGRQINTSWQMVRPFLAEMEESRRVEAIDRINNEWAQTQKEILQCL